MRRLRRFVYGSNRVKDSDGLIVTFAIDQTSGMLTPVGWTPSGGATPRNFALAPSGRHMLVANQVGECRRSPDPRLSVKVLGPKVG